MLITRVSLEILSYESKNEIRISFYVKFPPGDQLRETSHLRKEWKHTPHVRYHKYVQNMTTCRSNGEVMQTTLVK